MSQGDRQKSHLQFEIFRAACPLPCAAKVYPLLVLLSTYTDSIAAKRSFFS